MGQAKTEDGLQGEGEQGVLGVTEGGYCHTE